ncbi:hypothetical protein LX32DRAFT_661988 [Colletotrichum zoysiae]|uniref:BZIP domain-containing protein n=1 Tax=Colletotrichum zoysiae TaxID=1216348 RepID=A0AAD9HLV6_9PEZI|nr:hypothetical protein LX32DRAFT_661988 [Colletotrichum zoysiae]
MSSVQWEAERQSHQSFEATRPTTDCTTASWSLQPGNGYSYQQQQQYLHSPQSAILSPPLQWPASTCDPLTRDPARQPPFPQKHRAIATKKRATIPARKPAEPRLASMSSRNYSKTARVAAVGTTESPLTSSMSSRDKGARAENNNGDEESDESLVPAGPDWKKPYRVKNRAAAKRCREKTKQYEIDLTNRAKQVTEERVYLDACVTALKNEVLSLKNQILQHGSCDCDMIQGYITRTASSVSVAGHDRQHATG